MPTCPSCAAPLDADGVCTACGALSRGMFRDLDLGPPQLAAAVSRGLDFYRLLGVDPAADTHQLARRYRQLRVLFPDDPSDLAPDPARRLALLEVAGRTLTDPALRRVYDDLRAGGGQLRTTVRACAGCTAPLDADARVCPYCGTAAPDAPATPSAPPTGGPPPAEPVDYYALIGLTPVHLVSGPAMQRATAGRGRRGIFSAGRLDDDALELPEGPPDAMAVDAAAYARERETLLAPGPAGGEREARAAEIDLARRILRDERRRSRYDALWRAFQSGAINITHLEGLRALQDEVRLEVAEERGERPDPSDAASLLRQGLGLAQAGMSREAIEPLRAAVRALPDSAEAHQAYAGAILASGDPLDLGAHLLRQALASIEASERLGAMAPGGAASAALCRGLLARDAGDAQGAEEALRAAVREDRGSGAAWRGLAALALARGDHEDALAACRRALAIDRRDERALLMAAAACARARRHGEAREAAGHIAALRGGGWTAEEVLREIV